MSDTIIAALIVAILGPVIGLLGIYLTYFFVNKNNIKNKKREIAIRYLIETYRKFNASIHRASKTEIEKWNFEEAITDIQFLGSLSQNESLLKFLEKYKNQGDPEELLNDIRKFLRNELGLEEIQHKMQWFRFEN